MQVRILVGAHAYACIDDGTRKTDILLSPGRSAPSSLRETALESRQKAERLLAFAALADTAALVLEQRA